MNDIRTEADALRACTGSIAVTVTYERRMPDGSLVIEGTHTSADHAAARLDHIPARAGFQAEITQDGLYATEPVEVAAALHAVFPEFPFALRNIETVDNVLGLWIVPVPRTVGLLVIGGEDFGWSVELDSGSIVSVLVPAS